MNIVDINEETLHALEPDVLEVLLKDRTTNHNIFWATNDYKELGDGYDYFAPILSKLITGKHANVIRPRVMKARHQQSARAKAMAEVFTPAWICNAQNNLIDNDWFGRENVFNIENKDHTWTTVLAPIEFPKNRTWKDYVMSTRLEITCGEAPYITSRYDVTTGEFIEPKNRIGLLDRKLRVIGENTSTIEEWIAAATDAYKNIYAYEWQGDNLLLARESMLWTLREFFADKFQCEPPKETLLEIATIISWNVWQMDGLKCVVPNSCHDEIIQTSSLFPEFDEGTRLKHCRGCEKNIITQHNGVYCTIKDWFDNEKVIHFHTLLNKSAK